MIMPCPSEAYGPRCGAGGGQLYRSTSGQVLVSEEVAGERRIFPSHSEPQNHTLRRWRRRSTQRVDNLIEQTSAMASGIEDHPWKMAVAREEPMNSPRSIERITERSSRSNTGSSDVFRSPPQATAQMPRFRKCIRSTSMAARTSAFSLVNFAASAEFSF